MVALRNLSPILLVLPLLCAGCGQSTPNPESAASKSTVPPETDVSPEVHQEPTAEKTEEESTEKVFEYHNPLTAEQQAEGWISLFDGQSLFGWESTDDQVNWRVSEGAIVADSGPAGFLMTTLPFADYELVCEYRSQSETNSGIFLRAEFPPGDITNACYEVNIAESHPDGFTTGSLVNRKNLDSPVEHQDGWNELRIKLIGSAAEILHNGELILHYSAEGSVASVGRIGLQKNAGKIEFRKIILKPLSLQSLFNGQDLTGWREVPGSKSVFTVQDGEIHVKNGQGFIETEDTFENFIFQSRAISHAAELNSGFFFRAMPGTEEAPSNGYEYQIHNGFEKDRSQPNNAGTGAIFRRVDARYVVANDKEWFTATLIANGPRIGCWVDGYQVVDWVDDRKPDENPRRGLRLKGGHISIQGHDPTTDLSFKDLKIMEYPQGGQASHESAATSE